MCYNSDITVRETLLATNPTAHSTKVQHMSKKLSPDMQARVDNLFGGKSRRYGELGLADVNRHNDKVLRSIKD